MRSNGLHSAVRSGLLIAGMVLSTCTRIGAASDEPKLRAAMPAQGAQTREGLRAEQAARTLAGAASVDEARRAGTGGSKSEPSVGASGVQIKLQYTGELISVNLKDVDIKDFFRLIHEVSGLNVIVDPNVTGTLTLVLDRVPWDQALDIVLRNNGLGKALEGNVLRIAKIDTLIAEQEAARRLAAGREEAEPLVTVFRPLSYAKVKPVAELFKNWAGGGGLSKRGTVLVDERNNTLIVSDISSQIPIIDSILAKLDKRSKQVSIEARIVLANSAFTRSLGTILTAVAGNNSGSTVTGAATGPSATGNVGPVGSLPSHPQPIVSTSALSGFSVFAISNSAARYAINAALEAAESRDQAKTISAPSIVTQDNVLGEVIQGTQIPIQTTINNTISVQFVNATLTLSATPQVTADGHIFMVIRVQNSSPGALLPNAPGPEINTQAATTQVLVPDGGTVVFGGVKVTVRTKSATQVPFLGSLPGVGDLFKLRNEHTEDQELLFFVTPKVLEG